MSVLPPDREKYDPPQMHAGLNVIIKIVMIIVTV